MAATTDFYIWFYSGMNGLGGWFLFFLVALVAVVWMMYDASRRRLPVTGWKMAVVLLAALLVPAIIFRFSSAQTQLSLSQFTEVIFYLGLLGGILPAVLCVGYFFTFRDMVGCPNGHIYEQVLGQCPECPRAVAQQPVVAVAMGPQPVGPRQPWPEQVAPQAPQKPRANAWLVSENGRTYQLYLGETTIGRSASNDIKIDLDTTVSRQHAKVQEQNGHYRIYDLGSSVGTRLNGRRMREPMTLEPDDVVILGEKTVLRFKC